MPADECSCCESFHPGGEGLVDGLCPACRKAMGLDKKKKRVADPELEESEEE